MIDFAKIDRPFRAMGLIVPDDEPSLDLFAACGCLIEHDPELDANADLAKFFRMLQRHGVKVETPSIIELQLASRMHRWKDLQKLQRDFYKALEDKVWEYERDALKLFGLPSLEDLQRDAEGAADTGKDFTKAFELTPTKRRAYLRIMKEWMLDLIGRDKILTNEQIANLEKSFYLSFADAVKLDLADLAIAKQYKYTSMSIYGKQPIGAEIMPIYDFNMLSGFSIGQRNTWKQILDNYRSSLRQQGLNDEQVESRVRELLRTEIIPQASNRHLAYFMNTGKNRIQANISSKIYAGVLKTLQQMAREGRPPLEVGRYLHRMYGGQLWQWLRIARSEPVLAYNAAFDEQSKAAGVNYEEWNCASGACDICLAFDGRVWRLGFGPQPVSDTHPHCTLSDTKIVTYDGLKEIKDVEVGELVLTHKDRYQKVTFKHIHEEKNQRLIYLSAGYLNIVETIPLTLNHPIFLNGKWVDAGKVQIRDKVRMCTDAPSIKVRDYYDIPVTKFYFKDFEQVTLYNLSVEEDESYIANGFVVHNCLCIRLARFTIPVNKPLQQPWSRVSPYEQGYKPDEIAGLGNFLNNNIVGIPRPGFVGGLPGSIPQFMAGMSKEELQLWLNSQGLSGTLHSNYADDLYAMFNGKFNGNEFMSSYNVPGYTTKMRNFISKEDRFTFGFDFLKGNDVIGSVSRQIVKGSDNFLHINHTTFNLKKAYQGKGIAKQLLAKNIELYKTLGIKNVRLYANSEVGSYAWALYGFEADPRINDLKPIQEL